MTARRGCGGGEHGAVGGGGGGGCSDADTEGVAPATWGLLSAGDASLGVVVVVAGGVAFGVSVISDVGGG